MTGGWKSPQRGEPHPPVQPRNRPPRLLDPRHRQGQHGGIDHLGGQDYQGRVRKNLDTHIAPQMDLLTPTGLRGEETDPEVAVEAASTARSG